MSVIIDWKHSSLPLKWEVIFGNKKPIILDIGCGNGDFLIHMSKNKNYNFVGIEIADEYILKAQKKVEKNLIGNVKLLKTDAYFALECLFSEKTIEGIYVNFPDPWEKKKQQERRLFKKDFINILASRLKKGAKVTLLTDHEGFKKFVVRNFEENGYFKKVLIEENPEELRDYPETNYLKKWRSLKKKIYVVQYELKKNYKNSGCSISLESDIPNIEFKKKVEINKLISFLSDYTYKGDFIFHVRRVFYERKKGEISFT